MNTAALIWLGLGLPLWLAGATPGEPTTLLERDGQLLVGTDRGLYRWGQAGWSVVLTRGVSELAGGARGDLVASVRGLYRWSKAAPVPRATPLGAGARVRAVAVDAAGTEWVATEVGLFRRAAGARAYEREVALPPGNVSAVRCVGSDVWAAMRGRIFLSRAGERFALALGGLQEGWWELCGVEYARAERWLCVPEGLWRLDGESRRRIRTGLGRPRALAQAGGRLWLATERGVYPLPVYPPQDGEGKAEAGEPLLLGDARALLTTPRGLLVATPSGVALTLPGARAQAARGVDVAAGASAPSAGSTGASGQLPLRLAPRGPGIEAVRRAVLGYLELSPARIARLSRSAQRAPLWPQVRAILATERSRSGGSDYDQTFSTGEIRNLFDSGNDSERGYEARLQLDWDLGALRDPARELAISRERRELIELRDQVLERVNRLYFERQRVVAELEHLPPGAGPERDQLELRAHELAAGLDAWSGGMFSRLVGHVASGRPELSPRNPGRTDR